MFQQLLLAPLATLTPSQYFSHLVFIGQHCNKSDENVTFMLCFLARRYYITNWLTEKSDVYSFGVVLMEIITSRPAIERSESRTHVSQFVSSMLAEGDIKIIVDPRLQGNFNSNSVWKAVEIAMGCVSPTAAKRPTMSQVVVDLKECMATELARGNEGDSRESMEMINMDLATELKPLAR